MNHSDLVTAAGKLLRNKFHCRVVLSEHISLNRTCETPDSIGWVGGKSILIECKTTIADFRADQKKFSRRSGIALGNWRFYLAPEGVLNTNEVPDGWGLYNIRGKRIYHAGGVEYANAASPPFESDLKSEVAMLVSALARI